MNKINTEEIKQQIRSMTYSQFCDFITSRGLVNNFLELKTLYDEVSLDYKISNINAIKKPFDMDIASCKLMTRAGNSILLSTPTDGTGYYAIISNDEIVPNHYRLLIVLNGKYKIMSYDCSKSYDDEGEEIQGNIYVYSYETTFIFVVY